MWEILTEGGIALILLIDNSRGDPLKGAALLPRRLQRFHPQDGRGHRRHPRGSRRDPSLSDYQQELDRAGFGCVPVFE